MKIIIKTKRDANDCITDIDDFEVKIEDIESFIVTEE